MPRLVDGAGVVELQKNSELGDAHTGCLPGSWEPLRDIPGIEALAIYFQPESLNFNQCCLNLYVGHIRGRKNHTLGGLDNVSTV